MLNARAILLVLAMPLSGCGGPDLDARAQESVDRLGERERAAAQVLVKLEQASRDKDSATLCSRVYAYEFAESECEQGFTRLLDREQTMALEVQDVDLEGDTAIAHADVTIVNNDGDRRTSRYTFQLVNREQTWRVKLQE